MARRAGWQTGILVLRVEPGALTRIGHRLVTDAGYTLTLIEAAAFERRFLGQVTRLVIRRLVLLILMFGMAGALKVAQGSDLSQAAPLNDAQWQEVALGVELLTGSPFFTLTVHGTMENRDALDLSWAQLAAFRSRRKTDYRQRVGLMNEIIRRR